MVAVGCGLTVELPCVVSFVFMSGGSAGGASSAIKEGVAKCETENDKLDYGGAEERSREK